MAQLDLKPIEGKRILLTGHTGFKGTILSLMLKELGAEVVGLSLPPTENSLFQILGGNLTSTSIYADIRDLENLKLVLSQIKPDGVFHLAAQPLVLPSFELPIDTFETNFNGTLNLLEAMRSVENLEFGVMITTDKVYRNNELVQDFIETDALGGSDPYSASKAAAEIAIESMRKSFFQNSNCKLVAARAGNVIGGGDTAPYRLFPDLVRSFATGVDCEVRNPESIRPWQHVFDPLYGYLLLATAILRKNHVASAYNFGPNHSNLMKVREVAARSKEIWNSEIQINYLQQESKKKEAKYLGLNSDLAMSDLSWKNALSIDQTLTLAIEWEKFKLDNQSTKSLLRFTKSQVITYLNGLSG